MHSRLTSDRRSLFLLILLVFVCSPVFDSHAQSGEPGRTHWGILRVQGLGSLAVGDDHVEAWNDCGGGIFSFLDFSASIDVNNTVGVLGSFEYVLARRYGIELSFLYWWELVELKFEVSGFDVTGAPNFILPTLGGNYHFLTGGKTDVYAGLVIGTGLSASGKPAADIEVSMDVALGLNLGLDYYINDTWSFGGTLKYMDFGNVDFSVLPPGVDGFICNNGLFGIGNMSMVTVTFGAGYKF
jgi:opacity protein-like surface antigen